MFTRIRSYLDERLGLSSLARATLDAPVPGGAHWSYAFGAVLGALFVIEFVTGLALMTAYAPSAQTAWASVYYIQHRLPAGAFVRGVHHWAAQAMLVVLGLHIAHKLVVGAYRRPREFKWWAALALLGLAFGFAHTGALLPWDQKAYWTTQVEASITGTMPVVGRVAQRFFQGGRELGTLAITRLHAAHVGLLPVLTFVLVVGYVALHRRHGPTPPLSVPDEQVPASRAPADLAAARESGLFFERYWPRQAAIDALAVALVVGVVAALATRFGAPLDAPADPDSDYPARPEWYLLGLFKLRKAFEGPLEPVATAVIPGLVTGLLVSIPILDRKHTRALKPRLPVVSAGMFALAAIGGLTALALWSDLRNPDYQRARALADQRAHRAAELAAAGVPPEGPLEMIRNDPALRPGQLFAEHCASCHAPPGAPVRDAQGNRTAARGPTLVGFGSRAWARALLTNPDADELFGRTEINEMPALAHRLGEDGVAAVAEYLYSQSLERDDPAPDPRLARRGDEIYHQRCTVCHQGPGDQSETDAEDRDAPNLTGWGSRAWLRDQILRPAAPENYGERNHMPAFEGRLSEREIEWLVDYVREQRQLPAPTVAPPPPRPARGDEPADG